MAGGQTPGNPNPQRPQRPRPPGARPPQRPAPHPPGRNDPRPQQAQPPWEQASPQRPQNQYPPQGPQQGYPPGQYPQQAAYQPYGQSYAAQPQFQGGMPPPAYMPAHAFGGFWIRLLALFIDGLVLFIPNLIISFIVLSAFGAEVFTSSGGGYGSTMDPQRQTAQQVANLIQLLVGWGYFSLMTWKKGGTVGKMALGLRVVDEQGLYPSFGRATGRYFAKMLSALLCLIGYIMAGFHGQKRALHDLIGGTYVVRKEWVNPAQQQMEQQMDAYR